MNRVSPQTPPNREAAEAAARALLVAMGFAPEDPGLSDTPRRMVDAFMALTSGYATSPSDAIGQGFPTESDQQVVATKIPVLFTCPHHLMPARGTVGLGFVPKARVPGLVRIAHLVEALSRRLILQEDLTEDIVTALTTELDVRAAVAIIEAQHGCVATENFAYERTWFRTQSQSGPPALVASLSQQINDILKKD